MFTKQRNDDTTIIHSIDNACVVYRFVSHDSTRIPRQGFYRRPQSRHTFRRQQDGCYSNPEVRKTVRHENAI